MKAIIGQKKGMTRVLQDGKTIPVTVIDTQNCVVSFLDDHFVELGIDKKKAGKREIGRYKGLGFVPKYTKNFKTDSKDVNIKLGDKIKSSLFQIGDSVDIKSKSKGKGFAGVVKRWGFAGGPKTHGQSDRLRAPGSIGAGTTPGRVLKGKKMPGRMGGDNITMKNKVIVDIVDSYILLSGNIPGSKGDYILIYGEESNAS